MKIGEKGGVIQAFARLAAPVFSKLFPDIPRDHPIGVAALSSPSKLVIGGDTAVFTEIINASFASAKTGFEISL